MNELTCACCGKPVDWDASYGREEFLVCESCLFRMMRVSSQNATSFSRTLGVVMEIGTIRREQKEKE